MADQKESSEGEHGTRPLRAADAPGWGSGKEERTVRESGDERTDETRGGSPRRDRPAISRRAIKRDEDTSELLERGETPTSEEMVDPSVDSPSEITSEGGPGIDASHRFDAQSSESGEIPNLRIRGTGREGGYSTLGGGVYPDEGPSEDAPHYGDWQRHSSGATSGARGQEGLGSPGEHTWGEEQYDAERREEQGRSRIPRPDQSLAREISEMLTENPKLNASGIEVEVVDGAVTITGEVECFDAKLLAKKLVESVQGVQEVHNRLRVAR